MFLKIASFVGALLLGFATYVYFLPAEKTISREIVIQAPPESLFPMINHSKKMNDWMPWLESDPGVKMVFSGPDEGVGSKSEWDSPGKMGTGSAVVMESNLNQSVKTQLTYTKPIAMSQVAEVTLTPTQGGTKVTWSVECHNSFFFRLMGVLLNVDKMVGGEFEKGLNKLKLIAESSK